MRRILFIAAGLVAALLVSVLAVTPALARPPIQSGRPDLPDPQQFGTEHFLIHYTFTGRSAIDADDADENGVPDYVELIAGTLEYVWQVQIDELGWPPPASDARSGGDERIDVYLAEILADGYAGYVDTEGGYLGDNPLTTEQERRAAFAFMVLDDDYDDSEMAYGETPEGLMRATAAHEFNHAVQAGIDDRDLHAWLYEAAATWMEDEVYDDIDDGIYYLNTIYNNPDICLVAETARGDDLHWYGSWLRLRLISERLGRDVVREMWENMRQYSGFGAVDAALAAYGTNLAAESRDFAVANLLRAYEEGDFYPTIRIEGEAGVGAFTPPDGVQSLGADYVRLGGSGRLTVTLDGGGAPLSLRVVALRGSDADVYEATDGGVTFDRNLYSEAYAVVHGDALTAHANECAFSDYSLEVTPTDAGTTPVAFVWPADRFIAPVGTLASTGEADSATTYRPSDAPFAGGSRAYAATPEELEVDFQTIIPAWLPPGYAFDYGYVMQESDFGDSAPFYMPGGGQTANFDYLDGEGNWISVAESVSPHASIEEWMNDIHYIDSPGEIRTLDGVDVLVEDLSADGEVWISATLIVNDLFIVVDGDSTEADVLELVSGLIEAAHTDSARRPGLALTPAVKGVRPTPVASAPGTSGPGVGLDILPVPVGVIGLGLVALCCLVLVVPLVGLGVFVWRRRG